MVETRLCGSFSYLLCSQSTGENRGSHENRGCTKAIERGVEYYVKNLFDERGLPKPFSRRPRMTVYRRELYDYAECINVAVLLRGRFPALDNISPAVLQLDEWQKNDGSFRSRQLLFGLGQHTHASLGPVAVVQKSLFSLSNTERNQPARQPYVRDLRTIQLWRPSPGSPPEHRADDEEHRPPGT